MAHPFVKQHSLSFPHDPHAEEQHERLEHISSVFPTYLSHKFNNATFGLRDSNHFFLNLIHRPSNVIL